MQSHVVFAKEPVPGKVKTRMSPAVPPEKAAELYAAFVGDVCERMARGAWEGDRRVLAAPGGPGPILSRIAEEHGFETATQEGPDLGARMAAAIGTELARGASGVLLVGTDSPTMPPASIRAAKELLDLGRDVVLGPAGDGGYWLIGAHARVPDVFAGVPWSTRDVLAVTLDRARDRALDVALLPFWYDVDDVAALRVLAAHLEHLSMPGRSGSAPRTRAAILALRASHPEVFRGGSGR